MENESSKLSPVIRLMLATIANSCLDELVEKSWDNCGVWFKDCDLPEVSAEDIIDNFPEVIENERRIEELSEGAEPTVAEVKRYYDYWTEGEVSDANCFDVFPIYLLAEVGDGDGNKGVALILRTGYAFTEIETWLEGVFATREEAMDWMLSQGRCVRAG